MASRRRAICLGLLLIGALGLIFASGVVFWLALGVVAVALVGILLPLAGTERFVRVAMVVGSVFAGLALLETALWLWESAASEPLPEFVAEDRRRAARARPAAGDPGQDRPHAERAGHAAVLAKA